ncbi:sensor histidine kinase ResE [Sporolactobacillus inulinus]|uniref:histidine kinase n=1 Tax=Sporolactobacillus inulinus TaxID=2078 RepID=A0A4Y1ZHE2_9BACL|nr:histidine kinase dimerization/phospho-acceptor domain-containing protein [Sporolactobacillus inulinus]GAY78622.1 sensor histidine kinase ResE [Sporolactobacillus inulinus]
MKKIDASVSHLRSLLFLSGIGAFLLALGMIWIMSKLLSHPLLQMQKMTEKMAKGNWDSRLTVTSHDEVGALGHSINDLAASLQRYRDTRQAFFSNISHELRTPVTYLQGYAKVLTDGLVASEKERKQYLSIIYQESVRLDRLISDLFDLSKMEEGQIKVKTEPLDLKEIMETVLQKVKLKAEKKTDPIARAAE